MRRRLPSRLGSGLAIALGLASLLQWTPAAANSPRPQAATAARPGRSPFPGSAVATVRFFAVNLDNPIHEPRCEVPLDPDGKLCESVVTPGITLSAAQAAQTLQLVRTPTTYSRDYTGCFFPHHALVFFDAGDRPVGYVSICFMCHQAAISPALPVAKPYAGYYALSPAGMQHLQTLCREAGLPYCDAKTPADFSGAGKAK